MSHRPKKKGRTGGNWRLRGVPGGIRSAGALAADESMLSGMTIDDHDGQSGGAAASTTTTSGRDFRVRDHIQNIVEERQRFSHPIPGAYKIPKRLVLPNSPPLPGSTIGHYDDDGSTSQTRHGGGPREEIRYYYGGLAKQSVFTNNKPDEISALVLDPGTAWTRAGFAGEDTPKAVIPSDYGFIPDENEEKFKGHLHIGDNAVHNVRENMEIRNPMKEGIVQDWDIAPKIWHYAISNRLTANTNEHPLLMVEPAWNPTKNREKSIEFAFEDFNVPAFYLAKSAVCAAFSSGKASAIIVDIGHGQASVTPVLDGLVLKKGLVKSTLAGAHLNAQLRHQLSSPPISAPLQPHFYVAQKHHYSDLANPPEIPLRKFGFEPTPSFTEFQQDRIFHEFKETTSQVWNNWPNPLPLDATMAGSDFITPRGFEFPNGYSTIFSNARYVAAESLFNPATAPLPVQPTGNTVPLGIAAMISKSLNELDVEIRPLLLNNVVVTGGSSLLYGFNDRLNHELNVMFPGPKVKLSAPGNTTERKYAAWIGGSVLGSLGAFHQMWISKQEYDEVGSGIVEKRCK